jgi:antitoxin component YwqK of YwqJK toxin-antitoxin module
MITEKGIHFLNIHNQMNEMIIHIQTNYVDGLLQSWNIKGAVFCNPPYGRDIKNWVKKAYDEHKQHNITILMLLPVRTDTKYFHEYIWKKPNVDIRYIRGRLKFEGTYITKSPIAHDAAETKTVSFPPSNGN